MRAGSSRDFAVCAELNWCRDSAFCQCGARILLNAVEVNPTMLMERKKNLSIIWNALFLIICKRRANMARYDITPEGSRGT